jgi:hypothetical protein
MARPYSGFGREAPSREGHAWRICAIAGPAQTGQDIGVTQPTPFKPLKFLSCLLTGHLWRNSRSRRGTRVRERCGARQL